MTTLAVEHRTKRRTSLSRYAQVAFTYTRPWYMRMWAAFIAWFVFAALVFSRAADFGGQIAYLVIGGTIAAWGGAIVAGHMKEQFADPRSRLMPGFRAPHLIVAIAVFLLGVIGFSLFLIAHRQHAAVAAGWPRIPVTHSGFLAVILLCAAVMAWSGQLQSATFIFTSIALGMIFVTAPGEWILKRVLVGDAPVVAAATIAVSSAALLALGWRLARMHEEMREYWTVESTRTMQRIQTTGDQRYRRAAASETGPFNLYLRGADRLERIRPIAGAGFWSRVRHYRRAIGLGRLGWLAGPLFVPFLAHLWWFDHSKSKEDQMFLLIVIPAVLSMTMPLLFTATLWPQRWQVLGIEWLRPVASRQRFVREQAAAMASDHLLTWISITAGLFATTLAVHPALMFSATFAGILLFIAAGQVWLFAVTVWVLRLRHWRWLGFFTFIGSLMTMGILLGRQMDGPKGLVSTPSPLLAGLVAVMGLIIAWDAYRRWLRTDLD